MPQLPPENLAYPTLIDFGSGTGSGFFVSDRKGQHIATAKHVLFDSAGRLNSNSATVTSYAQDPKDTAQNRFELDLVQMLSDGNIRFHNTFDVAVIRTGTVKPSEASGPRDVVESVPGVEGHVRPSGICVASADMLMKYDGVHIGENTIVFGYPRSIGLKENPQFDFDRPLLRKGIVAGKNPAQGTLIIDCPVYPGNSGGPVVQMATIAGAPSFKIIGLVSQTIPVVQRWQNLTYGYTNVDFSNSGYAVAMPVDPLIELLQTFTY